MACYHLSSDVKSWYLSMHLLNMNWWWWWWELCPPAGWVPGIAFNFWSWSRQLFPSYQYWHTLARSLKSQLLRMRIKYWELRIGDWRLRIVDWGLRMEDWGSSIENWGLRIGDCGVGIEDWGLGIKNWGLRIGRDKKIIGTWISAKLFQSNILWNKSITQ